MPDQPFLRLVDMLEQRGLVHAHLHCQFAGINPPGMIEETGPLRFQQDLFLFWREDIKNPGAQNRAGQPHLRPDPSFTPSFRREKSGPVSCPVVRVLPHPPF